LIKFPEGTWSKCDPVITVTPETIDFLVGEISDIICIDGTEAQFEVKFSSSAGSDTPVDANFAFIAAQT